MIYESSAIGEIALSLLKTNKAMRVHSIFNNGFNIVNDKNELIFIGTNKNGYFPFGITIDQYTIHHIKETLKINDTVRLTKNGVNHNDFMLMVNKAELYAYKEVTEQADISTIKKVVDDYDFTDYAGGDFNPEKLSSIIDDLADDSADFPLAYLAGRGIGLTPSGDDIITGILYVDKLQPFIAERHLFELDQYISQTVTTIVSENFIKLALKGIFSTRITAIGNEPSQESVDELLELGSSSGRDTLYGIYMTLNRR